MPSMLGRDKIRGKEGGENMPDNGLGAAFLEAMESVNNQMDSLKGMEINALNSFNVADIRDYNLADYSYEVIMERIKEFEDTLDEDHEIALRLASFGQSITLSVVDIGYSNPSTLVFHGYVGDQPATLIQHMSQLNFLLLAVKKADPEKPPRRIGFESPIED